MVGESVWNISISSGSFKLFGYVPVDSPRGMNSGTEATDKSYKFEFALVRKS